MKLKSIGNVIVNCATTAGSKIITPAAMAGITAGMLVSGSGIPGGAAVIRVYTASAEISQAATATGGAVTLAFARPDIHFDGFTIVNEVGDFGASCASYTPPAGGPDNAHGVEMRIVQSTNATPGTRLYIWSPNAAAWKYVALT